MMSLLASRRQFLSTSALLGVLASSMPKTVAYADAALSTPHNAAMPLRQSPLPDYVWALPREIAVANLNTGKNGSFLYFENGQYTMDAYYAVCALLLDHRENKAIQLDPALLNLTWAQQYWYAQAQGLRTRTEVSSPYRSAKTNLIVGGAKTGKHPEGKALDGRMQGVGLDVFAAMLWRFQAGGVGLYPQHVHWDVREKPAFWRSTRSERQHG